MTTIHYDEEVLSDGFADSGVLGAGVSRPSSVANVVLLLSALEGHGDAVALVGILGEQGLFSCLGPLEEAQLVHFEEEAGRVVFTESSIGPLVVASATESELRAAHWSLAIALAGQPEVQLRHVIASGAGSGLWSPSKLADVAREAIDSGHISVGVGGLVKAAESSQSRECGGRYLSEAALVLAQVGGDFVRASELLVEARARDGRFVAGSIHSTTAAGLLVLNRGGVIAEARSVLMGGPGFGDGSPGRIGDERCTSATWWPLMLACWFGGRSEWWDSLISSTADLDEQTMSLESLMIRAFGDPRSFDPNDLDRLDRAVDELFLQTNPQTIVQTALASLHLDRLDGCRNALERLAVQGPSEGAAGSAVHALFMLGFDSYRAGRWDEAIGVIREAMQMCDEQGYELFPWFGRYVVSLVAGSRDDHATVEEFALQASNWGEERGAFTLKMWARHSRALQAVAHGDHEQAYQLLVSTVGCGELPHFVPEALWSILDVVESSVRTGRLVEAEAHVKVVRQADIAALSPRISLLVEAATALVAPAYSTQDMFAKVLAKPGIERWPFEVARIELLYGETLREAGQYKESRIHLRRAYRAFEAVGASSWCNRAGAKTRGIVQTRPVAGVLGNTLTRQEMEIASLAAAGFTNREIGEQLYVSHRTVGNHLHRIFPKLGVSTRAGIRDALAGIALASNEVVGQAIEDEDRSIRSCQATRVFGACRHGLA